MIITGSYDLRSVLLSGYCPSFVSVVLYCYLRRRAREKKALNFYASKDFIRKKDINPYVSNASLLIGVGFYLAFVEELAALFIGFDFSTERFFVLWFLFRQNEISISFAGKISPLNFYLSYPYIKLDMGIEMKDSRKYLNCRTRLSLKPSRISLLHACQRPISINQGRKLRSICASQKIEMLKGFGNPHFSCMHQFVVSIGFHY